MDDRIKLVAALRTAVDSNDTPGGYAVHLVYKMEQQALQLLKRKLDALSYMEPVDEHSAPLVQKLVDDLVHTTESYRGLKQQSLTHHHHISNLNDKVFQHTDHPALQQLTSRTIEGRSSILPLLAVQLQVMCLRLCSG